MDEREDFDAEPAGAGVCRTCHDWLPPGGGGGEGEDAGRCLMCRRWLAEARKYRAALDRYHQPEGAR